MNSKELNRFKELFLHEISKLKKEAQSFSVAEVGDGAGDEMDQASAMERRNMQVIMTNRNKEKLAQLNVALSRINEGTFGICSDCDDDIEPRRLEVKPTALLCVSCQEELEYVRRTYANGVVGESE